jgi:hypothetical protein
MEDGLSFSKLKGYLTEMSNKPDPINTLFHLLYLTILILFKSHKLLRSEA